MARFSWLRQERLWMLATLMALLALDRLSKLAMMQGNGRDFGFFALSYVENTGASFGILRDMNTVLIFVALAAFGVLAWQYKNIPKAPLVLITAGLWGNLIDRIAYGFVVDFIDFKFFPVFNVADACITIGAVVWALLVLFPLKKKALQSPGQRNVY